VRQNPEIVDYDLQQISQIIKPSICPVQLTLRAFVVYLQPLCLFSHDPLREASSLMGQNGIRMRIPVSREKGITTLTLGGFDTSCCDILKCVCLHLQVCGVSERKCAQPGQKSKRSCVGDRRCRRARWKCEKCFYVEGAGDDI
jgi:hypothetical protein